MRTVVEEIRTQFHVPSVKEYRSPSPPKGELLRDRRPVLSILVSLCLSKCNQMPPTDLNLWQGTYLISSNSHQRLRGRQ